MKQRLAPRMPLASLKTYEQQPGEPASAQPEDKPVQVLEQLPGGLPASKQASGGVHDIAIELIDKSPHQPRLIFDPRLSIRLPTRLMSPD